MQSMAWGIALAVAVGGGVLLTLIGLSSVYGGGSVSFSAKGSPGPVTFDHSAHMLFKDGKYKACRSCHEGLFAADKYGTFVLRVLKDSPNIKIRIGKEASTFYVPSHQDVEEASLTTYELTRACRVCATGECHDGKESFGVMDCLRCHKRR
jgi:hypothetical protein